MAGASLVTSHLVPSPPILTPVLVTLVSKRPLARWSHQDLGVLLDTSPALAVVTPGTDTTLPATAQLDPTAGALDRSQEGIKNQPDTGAATASVQDVIREDPCEQHTKDKPALKFNQKRAQGPGRHLHQEEAGGAEQRPGCLKEAAAQEFRAPSLSTEQLSQTKRTQGQLLSCQRGSRTPALSSALHQLQLCSSPCL
ncbi:uncharacterized protein LOC143686572 [Tamandua tetradactyla]|uniref:uncharacterized protein LOC143686572 n=1 Tax=Tamandua tetradactyla TaxID=48850 RepID=UPI004054385C